MDHLIDMKILSLILCPLIKAVCSSEIILLMTTISLFAKTFKRSLNEELMRLIGLKSETLIGLIFLGTSAIKEELAP